MLKLAFELVEESPIVPMPELILDDPPHHMVSKRPILSFRCVCFRSFLLQAFLGYNLLIPILLSVFVCGGSWDVVSPVLHVKLRPWSLDTEHSGPQLADCSNNLDMTKRASRVNKGKKKHQLLIHLL